MFLQPPLERPLATQVRIPVGYWLFWTREQLQAVGAPYVAEGVRYLDAAFDAAAAAGLDVLVNLHGAPGSQNGLQESGQLRDNVGWTADDNVRATLDVLEVRRSLKSRGRLRSPTHDRRIALGLHSVLVQRRDPHGRVHSIRHEARESSLFRGSLDKSGRDSLSLSPKSQKHTFSGLCSLRLIRAH